MYEILLLIKTLHLTVAVCSLSNGFVIAQSNILIAQILNRRKVPPFVWLLLLVLAAADIGFFVFLGSGPARHSSIIKAEMCVGVWFVVIQVMMKLFGMNDPIFTDLGINTFRWWLKYTLAFVSVFLSLVGGCAIFKAPGPALEICEKAAFFWILTYLAFTFENAFLPTWVSERKQFR